MPVLDSPAAITVVALVMPVLPMSKEALLVRAPPIFTLLPLPPNGSISTKSVLVSAPVTVSFAAAVPPVR